MSKFRIGDTTKLAIWIVGLFSGPSFLIMYYFPDNNWAAGLPYIAVPLAFLIYIIVKVNLDTRKEEKDARPDSPKSINRNKESLKVLESLIPYQEKLIRELEQEKLNHFSDAKKKSDEFKGDGHLSFFEIVAETQWNESTNRVKLENYKKELKDYLNEYQEIISRQEELK